jgi:calcium-dependent protein kinase
VHDGRVLGTGVSCVVRCATHRSTGIQYAVKCLDTQLLHFVAAEAMKQLRDEISIMCQVSCDPILILGILYFLLMK